MKTAWCCPSSGSVRFFADHYFCSTFSTANTQVHVEPGQAALLFSPGFVSCYSVSGNVQARTLGIIQALQLLTLTIHRDTAAATHLNSSLMRSLRMCEPSSSDNNMNDISIQRRERAEVF